ncbi:MAG: hypothetical protein FWH17_06080 [Oscillospiraceae bacterium]|nr:hypothetical protein [Oscillospiraceae bacterium]
MKTIILYYSRSGSTKALAEKKAIEINCDIEQIFDVRRPSVFSAIFKAIKRAKKKIMPIKASLEEYEKIIIMFPVWASHPPPAINSFFECLPPGKKIEIIAVSKGGGTKESVEGTKNLIAEKGCEVIGYTDLKVKRENGDIDIEEI